MKLICTLGEFAKPASATLPRYCGGAGGSRGWCLHSWGRRLLAWANRAPRELGRTQPGEKLPAEPARSVRAVKALPGCKTPFQAVKPLSDNGAFDAADSNRFSRSAAQGGNSSVAPAGCGAHDGITWSPLVNSDVLLSLVF